MRNVDIAQIERAETETARQRNLDDIDFMLEIELDQLQAQHRRGKRGGIDRTAQARPQEWHRAQMVLMSMGQHQANQVFPAFGDEAGIGDDKIDTGHAVAGEAHAKIDHQPFPGMAVKGEVHAEPTCPSQRYDVDSVV